MLEPVLWLCGWWRVRIGKGQNQTQEFKFRLLWLPATRGLLHERAPALSISLALDRSMPWDLLHDKQQVLFFVSLYLSFPLALPTTGAQAQAASGLGIIIIISRLDTCIP